MATSAAKVDLWNRALDRIGETDAVESEEEDRPAAAICRRHYDDILHEVLSARPWPWATRERILSNIDEQSATYDGDGATADFQIPYAFVDTEQLEVVHVAVGGAETVLTAVDDYTLTLAVEGSNAYVTLDSIPTAGQSVRVTVTTTRVGWEHVYELPSDCVTPMALLYEDVRYSLMTVESRIPFAIVVNDGGTGQLLCCDLDDGDFEKLEYVAVIEHIPAMPRHFINALVWRLAAELADGLKKDPRVAERCMKRYDRALEESSAFSQNLGHDVEPVTPSVAVRG